MSRTDFEAAYIERYGHRPRGWNDDFQVYQDAHANGAWFGWQARAAGIEAKAAPVGEREAFEAWCEESGQYVKSPVVFEAFQAGAAHQRQQAREVVMPDVVEFAVSRWEAEVKHRPLVNVHRRALDGTWRQIIRFAGGDPDELCGPDHDALGTSMGGKEGGSDE